ncbi:MAG: histone deacetylase family protein [Pararhodobacter sp.]|nr:histone deacetylase family protein [Pararhodobacter sp.]
MTTLLLTHSDCLGHVTPPGHPEQVARLDAVARALSAPDFNALRREDAPLADLRDLLRCHPEAYVERLRAAMPAHGHVQLDPDTHAAPGTWAAAMRAVGAACRAVDATLGGEAVNAFAVVRPPGHHAEAETTMGFCLFGAVAIAARHALDHHGLSRVAVVDFDVHHGNGTQALLWDEPRVRFVSSHQMPLWPGTGHPREQGAHGQIVNVPLRPGTDGAAMRAAYAAQVFPMLDAFAPELLILSAGFDAHAADPLAQLEWQTEDYAVLTRDLCALAARHCGGRVVSVLEGGYDLEALGESVAAHVREFLKAGQGG